MPIHIGIAATVDTNPAAGVIATRPATAPVANPSALGLRSYHESSIHAMAAAAALVLVATNADEANPPEVNALSALNPNHPNQSRPAPRRTMGIL